MAEIFAAVASGAGLVSLAIQLLESSRKLKGLYNTTKDAPRNVKDLCFDLETLSLQLRQLEQHRQHDHLDTELLDRCIAQCQRRTEKVSDLVDDMARYIRRSAVLGKLYAAFKEPEVEKLLDELERAKSSLSLTHISYCQVWNMRNAAAHTSKLQTYGDVLALQQMQLGSIQDKISDGNARLDDQLKDLRDNRKAPKGFQPFSEPHTCATRPSKKRYFSSRNRSLIRFRLPLLAWLSGRTWEIAVNQSQASWNLHIHPVHYRASESPALQYVREGNITAVDKLLRAGELSIWDVATSSFQTTLLGLAVEHRQLKLCDYLLTRFDPLRSDEHLLMAALELRTIDLRSRDRYSGQLFEIFVGKFDMDVDIIDACPQVSRFLQEHFRHLSGPILSHQSVDLAGWPLQERFRIAMRLQNASPLEFQRMVGLSMSEIAQLSDVNVGTALHWAVKEWYHYANAECGPEIMDTPGYKDVKKFLLMLLENKTLLHAVNKHGRTPLTCILDWNFFSDEDEPWLPFFGAYAGYAIPTERWGRLLEDAGVSLPQYVARENDLLTEYDDGNAICLAADCELRTKLSRLSISKDRTLQLEVTRVTDMGIWEFRPPAGRFLDSAEDQPTILWWPSADDGDPTCWQNTSSRDLRSKPFIWTRSLDADQVGGDSIFKALFYTPNDDHSALALLLGRDRQNRSQGDTRRHRRSSSMPPLGNAYLRSNPIKHRLVKYGFPLPGMKFVIPYLHKCLFDSRWGFDVSGDDSVHSWRGCMKGCRGRTDYSSLFEEFLAHTASQSRRMASELERVGRIVESD